MRFASIVRTDRDADDALRGIVDGVTERLDGTPPDLLVLFCTPHLAPSQSGVVERLQEAFPTALLVGCVGAGVLGDGLEYEGVAGISVLAAVLPGVELRPVHLDRALLSEVADGAVGLAEAMGDDLAGLLILSDPYTFELDRFVPAVEAAVPGVTVFGAQASGVKAPGPHELFLRGRVVEGGLVGVGFAGDVSIRTVVAHGCRPVGPPMFVTSCEGKYIIGLDGQDPPALLRDVYRALDPEDQQSFRKGQLVGIQMREQEAYGTGDFLIRHMLGVPENGRGVVIGGRVERFDIIQLQVRDAASAHQDLVERLRGEAPPAGALLITCLGRGRGLYGEAHHDTRVFLEEVGPVPMAGLFANGELGPVGGELYLHGYTSVFVLFDPA